MGKRKKYIAPKINKGESATDFLQRCIKAKTEQQGASPLVEVSEEEIYKQFKVGV